MREVHTLLSQRWIIRQEDPDTYYRLKDQYHIYHNFFKQKLGYNIIVNPLLIKAEKIPGISQDYMGIEVIKEPKGYIFLCIVLMFLEEKDIGEQFVLAQIIDYVKSHYIGEEVIDWTMYGNRKLMISVLRFCVDEHMILINDGDDKNFSSSEKSVEVLYENTGTSKYFMRRFPFDINDVEKIDDFSKLEWQSEDEDRGYVRRQRVYRRLFMEPVVYDHGEDDQDYLYIKNMRSVILNDVEKYLSGDFHLHKNGGLILLSEENSQTLPNRKNISDIVIQFSSLLNESLKNEPRDALDRMTLSDNKWSMYLETLKEKYGFGWSKMYREMVLSQLKKEIERVMGVYGMIEKKTHEIVILPMVGKINGDYPKDFREKNNG